MALFSRMKFTRDEVARHKGILIREIERESTNDEEAFFRFVWSGSDYQKSPLGIVEDVAAITPPMLETKKSEILKNSLFFYSQDAGLEIINEIGRLSRTTPLPNITWLRNKRFRNRRCNICYTDRRIEAFCLLTRVLKELNPGRQIQLSEKKNISALILETGTKFPTGRFMRPLRQNALKKIEVDISGIKSNIAERALNELESFYFYGKRWQERIGELFKTTELELLHLVRELNP